MLVSIDSALNNLGARFQHVDFDGIQRIVNTFSDARINAAVKADPQDYMIKEMKKNNIPIPDGLHFHWRKGTTLIPPEASDCVPPPSTLMLAAAPNKPFELELFQLSGAANPAPPVASAPGRCNSCFICIVFPLEE